jgi:hypothetical protein
MDQVLKGVREAKSTSEGRRTSAIDSFAKPLMECYTVTPATSRKGTLKLYNPMFRCDPSMFEPLALGTGLNIPLEKATVYVMMYTVPFRKSSVPQWRSYKCNEEVAVLEYSVLQPDWLLKKRGCSS